MGDGSFHYIRHGIWAIEGFDNPSSLFKIPVNKIWEECKSLHLSNVPLVDIDGYPIVMDAKSTKRIKQADITFPIILCPDLPTLSPSKYKIVDGRHRFFKMKENHFETIKCFVLPSFDVISRHAIEEFHCTGPKLEELIDKYEKTQERRILNDL